MVGLVDQFYYMQQDIWTRIPNVSDQVFCLHEKSPYLFQCNFKPDLMIIQNGIFHVIAIGFLRNHIFPMIKKLIRGSIRQIMLRNWVLLSMFLKKILKSQSSEVFWKTIEKRQKGKTSLNFLKKIRQLIWNFEIFHHHRDQWRIHSFPAELNKTAKF